MPSVNVTRSRAASRKSLPENSLRFRGGWTTRAVLPAGFPKKNTVPSAPAKRQPMNSAASARQPSSAASSNVQRSKRARPGRTRRRSAPSNLQSRKMLGGDAVNRPCRRLSNRIIRKSQLMKTQPASEKESNRAFRKSTLRSVARLIETTRSLAVSWAGDAASAGSGGVTGATSLGGGSLGSLAGWDTAPRGQLAGVGALRRLRRVRLLAVLDEDLVDLGHERVHELRLGEHAADLALAEERALPHSAGDADVGVLRLPRPVHLAAHDRDLHRRRKRPQALLGDLRERDEVDVGAPARRARDEREALIAQAERLQHVEARGNFLHRVLGERDADGVADALVQEDAHARGRADRSRGLRARLGHSEMQRVWALLREAAIGRDHHRHLERLHGNHDVVEVEVLEDLDLAECQVDHALRLVADVTRLAVADRAVVHADADGHALLLRA